MSQLEIQVFDNGPIKLGGAPFIIKDAAGNTYDLNGRDAIALCRCGASANKPFCDGAHRSSGFASKCEAHQLPPPKPKL
ncbi:MAG: CDGSH iron-sulfur domain-containing protein [Planctomycetes bacterium]|nr:CDGSH iron-sulfur domain-containing protein [Planctomycetota bacterium]